MKKLFHFETLESLNSVTGVCKIVAAIALAFFSSGARAQTTMDELRAHPEYTLGNYMPYPEPDKNVKYTKAPAGYKPFYISHYGRHGSRFHFSSEDYEYVYNVLSKAAAEKKLTPVGQQAYAASQILNLKAGPKAGDMTQVGLAQHEGIARRMVKNFPDVFKARAVKGKKVSPHVDAFASTSGRCILSMAAFAGELRKDAPQVEISYESGKSIMPFINSTNFDSIGYSKAPAFQAETKKLWDKVDAQPFMNRLFADSAYVHKNVNISDFYNKLFEIANSMAGMDSSFIKMVNLNASYGNSDSIFSLTNLFTTEEKIALWQGKNSWWYGVLGISPLINSKAGVAWGKNTLRNILDEAERIISQKTSSIVATLRFGHDSALLPLAGLMRLSVASAQVSDLSTLYEQWTDFRIIPMAANLQIVFYRNEKAKGGASANPILVKFLYNEREVTAPIPCGVDKCPAAPYYRWEDALAFYRKVLEE